MIQVIHEFDKIPLCSNILLNDFEKLLIQIIIYPIVKHQFLLFQFAQILNLVVIVAILVILCGPIGVPFELVQISDIRKNCLREITLSEHESLVLQFEDVRRIGIIQIEYRGQISIDYQICLLHVQHLFDVILHVGDELLLIHPMEIVWQQSGGSFRVVEGCEEQ